MPESYVIINGCTVSEEELENEIHMGLLSAGCMNAQALDLAKPVAQRLVAAWKEEDDNDGE